MSAVEGEAAPQQSRSRWLWTWSALSTIALVVAFAAGTQVRSPWQTAIANSQAHPRVTATVETRAVQIDSAHVTGTMSLGSSHQVLAGTGDAGAAVVTATPLAVGSPAASGLVLVEVSGRPVIPLDLPFPPYRDLRGGMEGPDVRALQEALSALDVYSGAIDGRYRQGTARAVAALFEAAGAEPPAVPAEAIAAAWSADEAVATAQEALAVATAAAAATEGAVGPSAADATTATRLLTSARRAADEAHLGALVPLPMTEIADIPPGAVLVDVASVGVTVEAGKAVATLRYGTPVVTARVGVADIDGYQVGAQVAVSDVADGARTASGTVTAVGPFQATASPDGSPPGHDIAVSIPDGSGLADAAKVVLGRAADTGTVEGLAVPLVAVREDGDGTYVLRPSADSAGQAHDPDESLEKVPVTITASAEGYAVVAPGSLAEGDVVVVATDR